MIGVVDDPFMPTTFGDAKSALADLFGPPQPLFSRQDFQSVLKERTDEMLLEIQKYPPNELLNTGTERLLDYFYDKYSIDVPVLVEENSSISYTEARIDATVSFSEQPKVRVGHPLQHNGAIYWRCARLQQSPVDEYLAAAICQA